MPAHVCVHAEGEGLCAVCYRLHIDRLIDYISLLCGDCKIIPNAEFVNEKQKRVS